MKCEIINDLLPLYIDNCCSDESRAEIERHLKDCEGCRAAYESMTQTLALNEHKTSAAAVIKRITVWKASVLQSLLLFISFGLITIGVKLEAATPLGPTNGLWAAVIVIPATGFMLSLANWYFVRFYGSRRSFAVWSAAITAVMIYAAYFWGTGHYLAGEGAFWSLNTFVLYTVCFLVGLILAVPSYALSNLYAKMIGKE